MQKLKTILVLSLAAMLPACGSVMEGATQDVRLETPGAQEAECTLNNGTRIIARTGQTFPVMKSRKALTVDCYASGNRHKVITVESETSDWAAGNIVTGVLPGMAYDHYSGGLYKYPDVITVDFVGIPTTGFELPDYHYKDGPNPYTQPIEDFGPSTPKGPSSEKTYLPRGIEKRDSDKEMSPFAAYETGGSSSNAPAMTPTPEGGMDKSAPASAAAASLKTTTAAPAASGTPPVWGKDAESLNRAMNPTVFGDK